MDVVTWLVQLISGAVGGNIAGSLLPRFSLGTIGNSIVGILGGGLGGAVMYALGLGAGTGATGAGAVLGGIASGGIGGGVLLAIIGAIRSAFGKSI